MTTSGASDERAAAYERWLATQPDSNDHYLLAEPRVRFEPRGTDVIVRVPGSPAPSYAGADRERDRRVLEALDGVLSFDDACRVAGVTPTEAMPLLHAGFGTVLLSPLAVAELESTLPAAEIVRFPGSPYEIVRSYWENMAAVRGRLDPLFGAVARPERFLAELGELHRVLLLGEGGASFYRPASPISRKGVDPGVLWEAASRIVDGPGGPRLVEGPRVSAAPVGGPTYWALLAESVDDPEALAPERSLSTADGLSWGRIVTARAGDDEEPRPFFCPPRPLAAVHAAGVCHALARARRAVADGRREQALEALGAFHQRLVRLHPFRAGNQSLVMNVVNALLCELGGAGIPHLVLDQLALRFDERAYAKLFTRAVNGWTATGSPLERFRALSERKSRYFSLLAVLDATGTLDEARVIARGSEEDAALALLSD